MANNERKSDNTPRYDETLAKNIMSKLPDKTLFTRVLNDKHAGVTTECLVQTGYVVDYLYDNQIPFRIEQTTSGGYLQLQAVTDSPKARITLTGKNDSTVGNHIDFIGSAVKANQRYAFTATPYDANGRTLAGQNTSLRTFRPKKEDINKLLDSYLKSDMTAFMAPTDKRELNFQNGQSLSVPNAYYQNGKLRKGYRTFDMPHGVKQDVELSVQPIQSNINGEYSSLSNSVRTMSAAINDSRSYLVEELMKASDFMLGKNKMVGSNRYAVPNDYGIDSGDISDMAVAIRDLCADPDSEYGIELAESMQPIETLQDIVSDYVSTEVLGLSKDENGKLRELPVVDAADRNFTATASDIPSDFTVDPTAVSAWTALSENKNSIVSTQSIISAMRGMGLTKDSVAGSDNRNTSIADSLITFNDDAAKTKDDFPNGSFEKRVLEHTENYLASLGITATCRFDDNGLIDISGEAHGLLDKNEKTIPVHAQIGQIFAPDEHNVVHVKRNQNDNFLFVPGYRAFIEADDGSHKNLMERTVLTGYFQSACASIDDSLSTLINSTCRAMNSRTNASVDVSLPTTCNSVYGETYGTQLPENYVDLMVAGGFDEDDVNAIYAALSGKIAYSREMDKDATTINSIGGEAQRTRALDIAGQNLREMGTECLGYVYTNMTNTGRGSGTRRYLCQTARVADDGHIIKGDEKDLISPLFSRPMFSGVKHNALDRNVMAFSQILTAQGIDKNARGCHMTIDGWTLDDGYVVSKEFAESHMVPDVEGDGLRPLKIGDKISDMNGNKGVINIVVDPSMSDAEAADKKIEPLVQMFRLNPELNFIGAPYSGMSRSNAGTALSMMSDSSDLHLPNGKTVPGGIGSLPILITGMTVDTKTHVYEEDDEHQRNSSGQLSWMLSSKKLDAIATEIYGDNDAGLNELRAYMNILGVTIDEKGNLHRGFGAENGKIGRAQLVSDMGQDDGSGLVKVKQFDEFVLDENAKNSANKFKLQRKNSAAKWDKIAKNFNGLLELPFPVQGADGKDLDVIVKDKNGNDKHIAVMPVVSAAYRSDIRHDNGETYSHDYTKNYATIVAAAGEYISAATRISKFIAHHAASVNGLVKGTNEAGTEKILFDVMTSYVHDVETSRGKGVAFEGYAKNITLNDNQTISPSQNINARDYMIALQHTMSPEQRSKLQSLSNELRTARVKGQSEYSNILNDTIAKKFEDRKHGAIATSLVKVGCKHSATCVWTADPRLEIDEVAMPRSMYDKLHVNDDHVLIWRDPLLRDTGMRYMKVVINDDLTGIAVNPMIDKAFDGDFDGDSLAVVALQTPEAQKEAMEKLTIKANTLDYGIGENGKHPILLQDGMDIKAALSASPKLKSKWSELEAKANDEVSKNGIVSDATFDEIKAMSKNALKTSSYENIMSYESPKSVAESLVGMSKEFGNGSKGNIKKMKGFMEYMGYDVNVDDKGKVAVKEHPMSDETRFEHNRNVCIALGCKCDETGVAGYASQKAIRALRDICPTEALELTYPVTQGMLQAKHDAAEAQLKANLTQNVIPDLWDGKRMLQDSNGDWFIEHVEGKNQRSAPKQATTEQWKDQFMRIMCQANGIDVPRDASIDETRSAFSEIMNPDALDIVAKALTDKHGKIVGATNKAMEQASVVDVMMYGAPSSCYGKSETITDYIVNQADKGTNLFNHGGDIFAPTSVKTAAGFGHEDTTTSLNSAGVEINEEKEHVAETSAPSIV